MRRLLALTVLVAGQALDTPPSTVPPMVSHQDPFPAFATTTTITVPPVVVDRLPVTK